MRGASCPYWRSARAFRPNPEKETKQIAASGNALPGSGFGFQRIPTPRSNGRAPAPLHLSYTVATSGVKQKIRAWTGVALYPFIHIGPLTLGSYGLMVATGLICAFFI